MSSSIPSEPSEEKKCCTACNEVKPLTLFKKGRNQCKPCCNKKAYEWQKKIKKRLRQHRQDIWRKKKNKKW